MQSCHAEYDIAGHLNQCIFIAPKYSDMLWNFGSLSSMQSDFLNPVVCCMCVRSSVVGRCDKSSPEDVEEVMGMSKRTFKQAIGQLYKRKLVTIVEPVSPDHE